MSPAALYVLMWSCMIYVNSALTIMGHANNSMCVDEYLFMNGNSSITNTTDYGSIHAWNQ